MKTKERPILFSAPMVRAILDGRKTMTRRVIKPQPELGKPWKSWVVDPEKMDLHTGLCPQGVPGDQLWVRETFWWDGQLFTQPHYAADGDPDINFRHDAGLLTKRPSIHMFRKFSRIDLKITNIRVERLQDISEENAVAEGVERTSWPYSCEPYRNYNLPGRSPGQNYSTAVASFVSLWDSINGKSDYPWSANPWVWVVEFERVK